MLNRIWFPVLIFMVYFMVPIIHDSMILSIDALIFPWLTSGFALGLLLWEIAKGIKASWGRVSLNARKDAGFMQLRPYLTGIAWLLGIIPLIYLLGFVIAIPLYLFSYLKLNGEKWLICIILTSLVEAFFWLIFVMALEFPFYEGLLFETFMD